MKKNIGDRIQIQIIVSKAFCIDFFSPVASFHFGLSSDLLLACCVCNVGSSIIRYDIFHSDIQQNEREKEGKKKRAKRKRNEKEKGSESE
jgi:hypothetical protein